MLQGRLYLVQTLRALPSSFISWLAVHAGLLNRTMRCCNVFCGNLCQIDLKEFERNDRITLISAVAELLDAKELGNQASQQKKINSFTLGSSAAEF